MLDTRQCCRRVLLSLALAGAAIWTTGCASPQLAQSRAAFHAGDFANAAAVLEDEAPGKDQTTVRHILVMYPSIRKLDQAGEDIRAHIRDLVAAARLEVLEKGHANLLPPSHRPKPSAPSGEADAN